jgi:hypothetical protein
MFKKIYCLLCGRYGPFGYTKCGSILKCSIYIISKYFFLLSMEMRKNNKGNVAIWYLRHKITSWKCCK